MKNKIDDTTKIIRNPNLSCNEIDGDVVMLSVENAEYYHLNSIGTDIWNILSTPKKYQELINTLTEFYEISKNECEIDTEPFLHEMIDRGIIVVMKG